MKKLLLSVVLSITAFALSNAQSLNFDGINDYASLGSINLTSYTKETWVYATNPGLNNNLISSDGAAFWIPGGHLNAGNFPTIISDPDPFPFNTWTHVAVTYDEATTTLTLYKNGEQVAQDDLSNGYTTENIFLGVYQGANLLQGSLDEVRIWNVARTQADIQQTMYCSISATQPGLVVNYTFSNAVPNGNNVALTTVTDESGNGNNATLSNFALTGTVSNYLNEHLLPITSVSIQSSRPYLMFNGSPITYTATPQNAGNSVTYQWFRNGAIVPGETSQIYTANSITTNDTISCSIVSNIPCNPSSNASSNTIVLSLEPQNALSFDGVDDFVNVGQVVLNGTGDVCVEGWVLPRNTLGNPNPQQLFFNGNPFSNGFGLYFYNNYIYLSFGGGSFLNTNVYIDPFIWSHVAFTKVGSGWYLYLNGDLKTSFSDTSIPASSGNTTMGGTGSFDYFEGTLDEFRFWNTGRSQSQIKDYMNCSINSDPNLKASYTFNLGNAYADNFTATTLFDASGNNYHATLNNFALSAVSFDKSNWVSGVNKLNPLTGVSIYADASAICAGQLVTFTATAYSGGGSPSFQWYKNGLPVGLNSMNYSDSTLVVNDTVTCMLTSSITCAQNLSSLSNAISLPVNIASLTASTYIASNQGTSWFSGQQMDFYVDTDLNPGNSPSYQWYVNDTPVGVNSNYFSSASLNDYDTISCLINSNDACVIQDTMSNKIVVHILNLPPNSIPYPNGSCYAISNVQYCDPMAYNYGNSYYDPSNGVTGDAMDDATILSTGQGDAYDGIFEVSINDIAFSNGLDNLILLDTTMNTIYTPVPQVINSLNVTKELHFYEDKPMVRLNVKLENPTANDINVRVAIASNLGSDSNTQLDTNSIGTGLLDDTDRWMITSDGSSSFSPMGDPVNTWVRCGSGVLKSHPGFYNDRPEAGNGNYEDSLNVIIPAHSFAYVVQFNRVDSTVIAAKDFVSYFDDSKNMIIDNAFEGINDLTKIVNWNITEPKATFTTNSANGCDSLLVNFVNTSTNADSLVWNFDDGSPVSTISNPSHQFLIGTYHVTLTAYNFATGLQNTSTLVVNVNTAPTLVVNSDTPILCVGQTATLSVSGANSYVWNTADTTSTVAVSPIIATTYTVTGIDTNGCANSATVFQNVSACTGIDNVDLMSNSIKVYPNPTNGSFVIELNSFANITVTNTLGEIIISENLNTGRHHLNIQNNASGVYYVNISDGKSQSVVKLIKL